MLTLVTSGTGFIPSFNIAFRLFFSLLLCFELSFAPAASSPNKQRSLPEVRTRKEMPSDTHTLCVCFKLSSPRNYQVSKKARVHITPTKKERFNVFGRKFYTCASAHTKTSSLSSNFFPQQSLRVQQARILPFTEVVDLGLTMQLKATTTRTSVVS